MNAYDKHAGKHAPWSTHTRRAFRQGWRRTDVYGFERYEDARRDWYILHGEEDAERYRHHDRSREERCTQALMALIFQAR